MVEYSGHNSNNNIIGEGLFRSFRSNYNRGQQEQQQHMDPKYASRTTTLLPLQVVKIVSQMIGELLSNKKRYISIIAAAIIAFGSFPSHVMAEQQTDNTVTVTSSSSTIHNMRVTPTITLISQTPTMIESDHKKDFLQYNDDEGDGDNFFATGGSYVEEESTTSTSTGTDSSMLTTETTEDEQEAQHIKYDSKNDHMSKVIGAVGGVIAGSTVTRMALFLLKKDRTSSEIMNQQDDDVDENENDSDNDNSNKKTEILRINSNTDRSSNILPLCDPKYVQARKQPKAQKDEALLAARYGAISDLEEKAYQILVDLGMIEVHHSL